MKRGISTHAVGSRALPMFAHFSTLLELVDDPQRLEKALEKSTSHTRCYLPIYLITWGQEPISLPKRERRNTPLFCQVSTDHHHHLTPRTHGGDMLAPIWDLSLPSPTPRISPLRPTKNRLVTQEFGVSVQQHCHCLVHVDPPSVNWPLNRAPLLS